ncbi:MAG: hypothetical protein ABI416_11395 [Ginsengibacter sp.]
MKEINLFNKKILYIGPASFNYDKYLVKKFRDSGAAVTTFDFKDLHPDNLYFKVINKLNPQNKEAHIKNFYNQVLSGSSYDYVLVRQGYQLDRAFLPKLRKAYPEAKFISFHWDSIRPQFDYLPIIQYFDTIFSFDIKDCRDHPEINYLPLFYLDVYAEFKEKNNSSSTEIKSDLLFIGSWRNMERYELIKRTEDLCRKAGLRFRHYLYFSLKNQFQLLKKGIIPKKARAKNLSHEDILKIFATTDTIIDFPSSFQTGLTIRTFETLGAGKKLMTTNKNIVNEPFYNREYIEIIDINNFTLNIDFIKNTPATSMDEKIKDYSIGNYINKLLR